MSNRHIQTEGSYNCHRTGANTSNVLLPTNININQTTPPFFIIVILQGFFHLVVWWRHLVGGTFCDHHFERFPSNHRRVFSAFLRFFEKKNLLGFTLLSIHQERLLDLLVTFVKCDRTLQILHQH